MMAIEKYVRNLVLLLEELKINNEIDIRVQFNAVLYDKTKVEEIYHYGVTRTYIFDSDEIIFGEYNENKPNNHYQYNNNSFENIANNIINVILYKANRYKNYVLSISFKGKYRIL